MFNIGDRVELIQQGQCPGEQNDWSKIDGLLVGQKYRVIHILMDIDGQQLIRLDGFCLLHLSSKFFLTYSKSHLPKWW